jgi:hypothetical protein
MIVTEEEIAVAKVVPAVAGATIYGLTPQDWVAIATLVYVALQAGLLMPKYWRLVLGWRRNRSYGGAEDLRDGKN